MTRYLRIDGGPPIAPNPPLTFLQTSIGQILTLMFFTAMCAVAWNLIYPSLTW